MMRMTMPASNVRRKEQRNVLKKRRRSSHVTTARSENDRTLSLSSNRRIMSSSFPSVFNQLWICVYTFIFLCTLQHYIHKLHRPFDQHYPSSSFLFFFSASLLLLASNACITRAFFPFTLHKTKRGEEENNIHIRVNEREKDQEAQQTKNIRHEKGAAPSDVAISHVYILFPIHLPTSQ